MQSVQRKPVWSLGKKGIAFGGDDSGQRTEYIFTKLNDIKPAMIEEATQNARSVAEKFAADSQSRLGKSRQPIKVCLALRIVTAIRLI